MCGGPVRQGHRPCGPSLGWVATRPPAIQTSAAGSPALRSALWPTRAWGTGWWSRPDVTWGLGATLRPQAHRRTPDGIFGSGARNAPPASPDASLRLPSRLREGGRVGGAERLARRVVGPRERAEGAVAQPRRDGCGDLSARALDAGPLPGPAHARGHDGRHVVGAQSPVGLVGDHPAAPGVGGHAGLGVVVGGPRRHAAEEVPGARVAHEPGILPHARRGLDVAVPRVGQGRHEQVALGDPAPLAGGPHGRAVPVDPRDLAGLAPRVVGGAPRAGV